MKSLKDSLVDYDLVLLNGLADARAVEPLQARTPETLATFSEALLSPVSLAIMLDELSATEREALHQLITEGNQLEARKFTRQYGEIRQMGPNKLRREKPWEHPQNPAEGLWYRGLIFKGFQHTVNGPEEVIFIPDDVQAQLPLTPPSSPDFQLSLAPDPAVTLITPQAAREDMFRFLAYLQMELVRLTDDDEIPQSHLDTLAQQFSHPDLHKPEVASYWLGFLIHIARRLGLLVKQGRRLKPNAKTVREWLQANAWQQLRQLQDTWRSDPTWNDLWHVPVLFPKATGWENSPLLGRAKILHYLSYLPGGEWFSLQAFIQTIKRTDPDFQRPTGNYQDWYIYSAMGEPLMGFEHWDQVEGGLIAHLIQVHLFNLGIVDLGTPGERLAPTVFRITKLGLAFFSPEDASLKPVTQHLPPLRVNAADFTIRVSFAANLYDRFQLARFATLVRQERQHYIYQITRDSYRKALEQSITVEQILAFLNRVTGAQTPLSLSEAIRNWDRRTGSVRLEHLTLLRVNDAALVSELINHSRIGPLLDRPFGPKSILVPEAHVDELQQLLVQFGYLDSKA